MKPTKSVSLLLVLTILSTLAYIMKLPEVEETQTKKGHDPFSILSSQLSSKHKEMLLKLRNLHLAMGSQQNGTILMCIRILLVTLSNHVQLNPGPILPKHPCDSCGAAIRYNQNRIKCDGCNSWYRIYCQGMNTSIHQKMVEHSSYSWNCLKCDLPNFSTNLFDDFSISHCSSNSFSILEASSLSPKISTPVKMKVALKKNQTN